MAVSVKNKELADVVLMAMTDVLNEKDVSFRSLSDGERELGKSIIEGLADARIDAPARVRIHFSSVIGYGYDFSKDASVMGVYQNAVESTKQVTASAINTENFLAEGVVDNKFGWYVTKLGK